MRRALIKLGDKTTAGGIVTEADHACTHHGAPLSYHGASIYCPACKRTGKACNVPPMRPMIFMGKQALLENDICLCGCNPPPRLIASQSTMYVSFECNELARMGFGPNGQPLSKSLPGDSGEGEVIEVFYEITDGDGSEIEGYRYDIFSGDSCIERNSKMTGGRSISIHENCNAASIVMWLDKDGQECA